RPPLHATLVAAGADERVPDELPGLRVEDNVDAALLADADDVALVLTVADLEDVRPRAAEIPLLAVGLGRAPGDGDRLRAARAHPGIVALHAVRPARLARLQIERDDGLEVRPRLLARLGEAAVGRMAG